MLTLFFNNETPPPSTESSLFAGCPSCSQSEYVEFWAAKIANAGTYEQVCKLLETLVRIDAGDADQENTRLPPRCAFIVVSNWTAQSILAEEGGDSKRAITPIELPFPDATGAAALLRQNLRVPFWLLFVACGLLDTLIAHIANLPATERCRPEPRLPIEDSPEQLLAQIFQRVLVAPFCEGPCADRLAQAVFGWKSSEMPLASDGLPPRRLCLELVKIVTFEWQPAAARFHAERLACEAALLQAQLNEGMAQQDLSVPPIFPSSHDEHAPSSSAESVDHSDPTRDTYLILTMSLDRQRLHIDMSQQILDFCVLERRLKTFALHREATFRQWQSSMLSGWKVKLSKELERLTSEAHGPAAEIINVFREKQKSVELDIIKAMECIKSEKDGICSGRETLKKRRVELLAELAQVDAEIESLTTQEVELAERLCQNVTSLETASLEIDREMQAALKRAEEISALKTDLRSLLLAQPEFAEEEVISARDVDSMPETTRDLAGDDEAGPSLPRTGHWSPPSVTTDLTGAATCGENSGLPAEQHLKIVQAVERLLEDQLPSFMSTERAFVQFCCSKLQAVGSRASPSSPQRGANLEVQRWQLYRPLLAQAVLTVDRLARSTEVALPIIFSDSDSLARMEASREVFVKGYTDCKKLIADNHDTIF